MRAVLGLFLVMLLSVTSVTAAVARGQMAGAVDLVICAGAGLGTVTLDATGMPVSRHHCPVCTAAPVAVTPDAPAMALRPVTRAVAVAVVNRAGWQGADVPVPVARGPPLAV